MRRMLVAVVAMLVTVSVAAAGGPIYHGPLTVRVSKGPLDAFGSADITARRWTYILGISDLNVPTNGIDLVNENLVLALAEETFVLPAGSLVASKDGKKHSYRGKTNLGIQRMKLIERGTNTYEVSFKLVGVNLAVLKEAQSSCRPFALIIGDDDGFRCLRFERPGSSTKRFKLAGTCEDGEGCGDWPWAG